MSQWIHQKYVVAIVVVSLIISGYLVLKFIQVPLSGKLDQPLGTKQGVPSRAGVSLKQRAIQLSGAEPTLHLDKIGYWKTGRWVVLSPNGRHLAARMSSEQVKLYDLSVTPPKSIAIDNMGQISAAFIADGQKVLLGTNNGKVVSLDFSTFNLEKAVQLATSMRFDEIAVSPDGKFLAWFDAEKRAVGLFNLEKQSVVRQWEDIGLLGSPSSERHIEFSQDGGYFIFFENPPLSSGREGGLVVWNVAENKLEAKFDTYVSYRTPGYTLTKDALYYGTRKDGPYQIRRWDFSLKTEKIVDPDARDIHFIDLFSSSGSRFIAEGDFEETIQNGGIRVYDIGQNHTYRTLGQKDIFVGWDFPTELLFATRDQGRGVSIWNPENGEMLGAINTLAERGVERIETSADGRILIALWTTSEGQNTPISYHITVLRIP